MFTFWDDKPGMTETLRKGTGDSDSVGLLVWQCDPKSACSTMYLFCVHVLPWSDIMASGRSWLVYVV